MRICVDEPFEDLDNNVVLFGYFHLNYLSFCAYMTIDLNTIACTDGCLLKITCNL